MDRGKPAGNRNIERQRADFAITARRTIGDRPGNRLQVGIAEHHAAVLVQRKLARGIFYMDALDRRVGDEAKGDLVDAIDVEIPERLAQRLRIGGEQHIHMFIEVSRRLLRGQDDEKGK